MSIELLSNVNLAADQLHKVRQEIKRLQAEEAELKMELGATGLDEIEGYNCKVVVTHVAESTSVDYKAVCGFLKVGKDVLNRFPKVKAAYDVFNIRPL